ncbi:DNA polymerase IV [Sutterella massiliensis]|uniref:DNA polymerase IV n=1 Tax=Sutterella massiliensis TaxID=1816689 RepID=A0ABS2DRG4_9BURK|nr:DNA polymerase IV [Sutterella massiliensis]MBM6703925.1 DNA polymerase IV [Sutterella massiliensis]
MSQSDPIFPNDVSRKILHIDMDAFYAAVEQRDRPELRGCPVAVGHADARGVVATASYEARRFGVRSAMPSRRARELCPSLVFVEGRMSHYKAVSAEIREIFSRYTDLIEPLSIDEAYLDVTHNKLGLSLGVEVARRIKADIRREIGLVASAGVSYNKFLAKIASDWRKPDGLCTIHPARAQDFIDKLPIEAFWGVGPATAKRFHSLGITTGAELRAMPLGRLTDNFGQMGTIFYKFARGIDEREVTPERERKSVGCEETFPEDVRGERLEKHLEAIAEDLARRLARHGFEGSTLTLKIRFFDFTTKTRSVTQPRAFLEKDSILEAAHALLAGVEIPPGGVRLLGLSVSSPLEKPDERQGSLFD